MTTRFHLLLRNLCLFVGLSLLGQTTVFAQTGIPVIQFQKVVGGSNFESLNEVQKTADGGSIAVGYSVSPASGDKSENNYSATTDTSDIWVVKLDATGAVQWENTIVANSYDFAESVKQTPDGSYIIGGNSMSNISGDKTENGFGSVDYWLIKLDANGVIQWQKTGQTSNAITVNPIVATTYTVTVTVGACKNVVTKTLTVNGISPSAMNIVGLNTQYYKNAAPVTLVGTPSGGTFKVDNVTTSVFNPNNLSVGNHTVNYRITQSGCISNIYRTVAVLAPPVNSLVSNSGSTEPKPEEIKEAAYPQISPNPADDLITIDLERYIGKPVELRLYNQVGQLVKNQNISEAQATFTLDISSEQSGLYTMQIVSKGKRDTVLKFVIKSYLY